MSREIALIDLDCFYCQVEQNRLSVSRDIPLAVRQWDGLVAVNYAARARGLGSRHFSGPDSLINVLKQCPELVLVHTDTMDSSGETTSYLPNARPVAKESCKINLGRYRAASATVMAIIVSYSSLITVEKASIDEAFLDLTKLVDARVKSNCIPSNFIGVIEGSSDREPRSPSDLTEQRLLVASHIVDAIRQRIFHQLNYTCSAGIAANKPFAKLIAGRNKPFQQTVLLPELTPLLLSQVSISSIRGLGGKFGQIAADQLNVAYLSEISSRFTLAELQRRLGGSGKWLWDIAHGIDHEPVMEKGPPKSFQASKTFRTALSFEEAKTWCGTLSIELSLRIQEDMEMFDRIPRHIQVQFSGHMASSPISQFTAESITKTVGGLMDGLSSQYKPCRGISLRVSGFTSSDNTTPKIDQFFKLRLPDQPSNDGDHVALENQSVGI
uniref:DNA polymerase eta n=1 Tax=Spongospora subterranea TaxID=70186 RepID=A0A0H5QL12_9EUKA|eukprot:CRZ02805.1 hypothetical protein [Spongospora subterranea]